MCCMTLHTESTTAYMAHVSESPGAYRGGLTESTMSLRKPSTGLLGLDNERTGDCEEAS